MRHIKQETGGQARHRGRRHLQTLAWIAVTSSVVVTSAMLVHVDARPAVTIIQASDAKRPYDTIYVPIEPEALQRSLIANSKDAIALVQLLRRADQQDQNELAFKTMNQLRLQQPNNPVVLAAYCFAFDLDSYKLRKRRRVRARPTTAEYQTYEAALKAARKLDPELWLTYAVEGHRLLYFPPYASHAKTLALFQKAVALAPDLSFTHYLLADAYVLLAARRSPPSQSYQKAATELEKALTLKPVSADAALFLLQVHEMWLPDKVRAHKAAQAALGNFPPGFKVGPKTRARLAKYGVVAGA